MDFEDIGWGLSGGGRWGISTYVYVVFACASRKGNGVGTLLSVAQWVNFIQSELQLHPESKMLTGTFMHKNLVYIYIYTHTHTHTHTHMYQSPTI
jgi:hypothetical protein